MNFGKRILVLVPHPDDEIVMCGAAIGRARAVGAAVHALYLTTGCIARENLWAWQRFNHAENLRARRIEGEQVAAMRGILPVAWSDRPTRAVWRNLPRVWQEVQDAIKKIDADQIWVPAYEGGHIDHDATNGLASALKGKIQVVEFAAYNWNHGKTQAQTFPLASDRDFSLFLTTEEKEFKKICLANYISEQKNLSYIGTAQESCRPLFDYDYTKPPHPGTLWYARFHWVPFHHPRIDRTTPQQVSRAITDFLAAHAA